jgi:hypothetical protein
MRKRVSYYSMQSQSSSSEQNEARDACRAEYSVGIVSSEAVIGRGSPIRYTPLHTCNLGDYARKMFRIVRLLTPVQAQGTRSRTAPHHFRRRTTKSGAGGANPAVTAYSELPKSAIVVGTFTAGFDVNGSVM